MATLGEALDTATAKRSKTQFTTTAWLSIRGNEWEAVNAEVRRVTADLASVDYLVTKTERVAFTDGTAEQGIVGCDIRATRARE